MHTEKITPFRSPRSVFYPSLFSRCVKSSASRFIRPIRPKTAILPDPHAVAKVLRAGWVAQLKTNGHRAQIHIPHDPKCEVIAFTAAGREHRKAISKSMELELRRLFQPRSGWNVIDADWLKKQDKLFILDLIKQEGVMLRHLTFPERWKLLPRAYLSPSLVTVAVLKDLDSCLKPLISNQAHVEGIILRSSTSPGFANTSIIHCRKRKMNR